MLLTPRSGAQLDKLIADLQAVRTDLSNRVNGKSSPFSRMLAYLAWAGAAARTLGYQISEADLVTLVLTPRYRLMMTSFGHMQGSQQTAQDIAYDLVTLEVDERSVALDAAVAALQAEQARWSQSSHLVMPDTGFYINYPDKVADVAFAPLIRRTVEYVQVLLPMVIVDELDKLKQHNKQHVRWRAGHTLGVVDRLFQDFTSPAVLHELDVAAMQGRVTVELLFDALGHTRLPIPDDEIIDRGLAVQNLAGRPVTLLTYDTGQSTRARNAGLKVVKLTQEIGPEPNDAAGRK